MKTTSEVENHSYHNGRDCYGRAMARGEYLMTRPGSKPIRVTVVEDSISGDLSVVSESDGQQVNQRLEDCAPEVIFERVERYVTENDRRMKAIRDALNGSDEARRDLAAFESEICEELGCRPDDGSKLADAVMAAVRDGHGTPYQLMQEAGLVD